MRVVMLNQLTAHRMFQAGMTVLIYRLLALTVCLSSPLFLTMSSSRIFIRSSSSTKPIDNSSNHDGNPRKSSHHLWSWRAK